MSRLLTTTAILLAVTTWARSGDDRPCVTIARTPKAPVIDGIVGADEWRDAAAVGLFLRNGAGAVADPGTVAYLTFDDRALHIAIRCAEPDPRRPHGYARTHDDRAFEDDCVQVFVAPEDLRKAGQAQLNFGGYQGAYQQWYQDIQAYYEFTVNCRGSRTEARNDVRDWDAPWTAAVGREPGGWVAELSIPFRSLGVDSPPDGALWGLNVFRSRQPDVAGWCNPSWGGYAPLPLGAMLLADAGPVVRQAAVAPPALGDNALRFTVRNSTSRDVVAAVTVTTAGSRPASREVTVSPGGAGDAEVAYALAGSGALRTAFEVKLQGEQVPLLSGTVPLGVPAPHALSLRYYAVPGLVEGAVHLASGAVAAHGRHAATKAVLTVQPPQGTPLRQETALTGTRSAVLRLSAKGAAGDRFRARLEALGPNGEVLDQRTREFALPAKPTWLGTKAGLPLGVLPPWTPIRVRGKRVDLLGKRLEYGDFALPASVVAAGAQLLAEPMRVSVVADGQAPRWRERRCEVTHRADDHVVVESLWRCPKLDLRVRSDLEYDGLCWNEVTLSPRGAVRIDRVALEIPLRRERCRYVYRGHAQAGHALSPLGLQCPLLPNLWLGDEERGLAWMTESQEWSRAQDRGRQVEVLPGGAVSLWRTCFLDTPTDLREPYTARFALHVTPAKPVSLRKSRIFHGAYYGLEADRVQGALEIPAAGHLDPRRGTLECWAKPTFDPGEQYDESRPRHAYNRQLLTLTTAADEVFILYYNADTRNLRVVTRKADGTYPVVLSAPGRLPAGAWSYVGLSWGDRLRLNVNGEIAQQAVKGTVEGGVDRSALRFSLADFQLDELRLSATERPLTAVPEVPFALDDQTLLLDHLDQAGRAPAAGCAPTPGRFGEGLRSGDESLMDQLARDGKRIVIFHEQWSRYQGYPDLEQAPNLRKLADACHARGMLFLVYFNWSVSTAEPEWEGFRDDLLILPEALHYHRDDVPQDCYGGCVNGPYGDLLLDGIAKLADQAGIDGVYMDGTTVPWSCANPSHPGCGADTGEGTYQARTPLRAVRHFMKRLRSLFAQRRKQLFLDAHTGGAINLATQSFCDGYYDGETLARYKPGFRLSPDTFLAGYMGKQFGFRADFLPNRHTMDQALAISLIHDTGTRGQPAAVDRALASYEDGETRFIPYWKTSTLYTVQPPRTDAVRPQALGSLYLKSDRALLVVGSQTEETVQCTVDVTGLLSHLPRGTQARDAITGERVQMHGAALAFDLPGRSWRLVEFAVP